MDFDAGGFAAGVEWNGHWGKQSSVVSFQSSVKSNDNAEAQRAQRKLLRGAGFGVEGGAAAGGGEGLAVGAEFGLLEEVAGGVEREMAVGELDAAAGVTGDVHVVRDHKDCVAGLVEFAKNIDDDGFVGFVEIAGWLVGEDKLRLIDEGAGDGDTLLFAAGKF